MYESVDERSFPINNYIYKHFDYNPSIKCLYVETTEKHYFFKKEILDCFSNENEYKLIFDLNDRSDNVKIYIDKLTKVFITIESYDLDRSYYEVRFNYNPESKLHTDKLDGYFSFFQENEEKYRYVRGKEGKNLYCLIATDYGIKKVPYETELKDISLEDNYNDDFLDVHNRITTTLSDFKTYNKGLILLYGKPGSGKTSYIKYLSNLIDREFLIIPSSLIDQLVSPSFIEFLLGCKNSTLILEDSEEYLKPRDLSYSKSGVSAINSLTDGIYSEFLNIKIIATFNSNIKDIDPALNRKGRLLTSYEFKNLTVDKTNKLIQKLGLDYVSKEEMALCDIYNLNDQGIAHNKNQNKIGF